jgi:hypothetical protein
MKETDIRNNVTESIRLFNGVVSFLKGIDLNKDIKVQFKEKKDDVVEIINLCIFASLFLADTLDCHYSLVMELLVEIVVQGRVDVAKLEAAAQATDPGKN